MRDDRIRDNPGSPRWVDVIRCRPSSEFYWGRRVDVCRHGMRSVMPQIMLTRERAW